MEGCAKLHCHRRYQRRVVARLYKPTSAVSAAGQERQGHTPAHFGSHQYTGRVRHWLTLLQCLPAPSAEWAETDLPRRWRQRTSKLRTVVRLRMQVRTRFACAFPLLVQSIPQPHRLHRIHQRPLAARS